MEEKQALTLVLPPTAGDGSQRVIKGGCLMLISQHFFSADYKTAVNIDVG